MRFILIRHGETMHNVDGSITGQMDVSLSSKGVEQAEKAAERSEKHDFNAAYSSDLERTYETTKIIADRHGLKPVKSKKLRERSFGKYEGEHKNKWREVVRNYDGDSHDLSPEKGESLKEVGQRFVGKLEGIAESHDPEEKILVGGHGVALKCVVMEILGLKGSSYRKLNQDNTGITELFYDENGWSIIRMNDTAHLE